MNVSATLYRLFGAVSAHKVTGKSKQVVACVGSSFGYCLSFTCHWQLRLSPVKTKGCSYLMLFAVVFVHIFSITPLSLRGVLALAGF